MHTKPRFPVILSFLALLGAAHGRAAPVAECTTKAWVRAPDLAADTIVHGDAKVKISAECPGIDNISLGLRFKERSFVKALRSRADAELLRPQRLHPPVHDFSNTSPWAMEPPRFANKSVEEAYEYVATNKDLWIVREEERVIFETTRPINMENGNHGFLRDAVQDFSILVPSTNFPPALDTTRVAIPPFMAREIVYAEWKYEYFAQVAFSNGTTREIPAGFTAFQPLHDPTRISQELTSASVELKRREFRPMIGPITLQDSPGANYSIEISTNSGLVFPAGRKGQVVNAVITRTGFARTFSAPLNIMACVLADPLPKWAAEHDMLDNHPRFDPTPSSVLRATSNGNGFSSIWPPQCLQRRPSSGTTAMMPNSTADEIQANEIVTTTSVPFTISVDVEDVHIPSFETYYETLANWLSINLETPRGEDEVIDLDDPYSEHDTSFGPYRPRIEDDEEEWVPWDKRRMTGPKTWKSYSGRVPVVVRPVEEWAASEHCFRAGPVKSEQVVLSDMVVCEQRSLTHYLDEGARRPTFVDHSVVRELLAKDPAERDLHAPILDSVVVSSPPKGEELIRRYYQNADVKGAGIYVGETWAKRVAKRDDYQTEDLGPVHIIHPY